MSSAKSPLLILDLVPSRILLISLGGLHLLAGSALLLSAIPITTQWLGGLLLLLSALHSYWRHGYIRGGGFIQRISWRADESWLLCYSDGREIEARLQGNYAHPRLLLLNFSYAPWSWRRRTIVLLADSSDTDLLRKLRARLLLTRLDEEIEEQQS